jgi:hypothetical protein
VILTRVPMFVITSNMRFKNAVPTSLCSIGLLPFVTLKI